MLSSLYSYLGFRVSKVVESNFVSAGLLKLDRSGLAGIHISTAGVGREIKEPETHARKLD